MEKIAAASGTEVDPEIGDRIKALGSGMTRYMMTGLNPFYRKWIKELREVGYTDPQVLIERLETAFGRRNRELDDSEEEQDEEGESEAE